MASPRFEILAYVDSPLGPLCLRRRETLSEPRELVTEITLNHAFLMSSLNTESERSLARVALEQLAGDDLRVLVGGLGLGYTAHTASTCDRVSRIDVVEYLPAVIDWLKEGLIPLADELNNDGRIHIIKGDVYARLLAEPEQPLYDAILIDVDHSPEEHLADGNDSFYSSAGISRAARHLRPRGILALWSYTEHAPTLNAMQGELVEVGVHPVTYYNRHVHKEFTDWIYTGRRPD